MTKQITFDGGPHDGLVLDMPDNPPETVVLGADSPINDASLYSFADGVPRLNVYGDDSQTYFYELETFPFAPTMFRYIYEATGQEIEDMLTLLGEGQPGDEHDEDYPEGRWENWG